MVHLTGVGSPTTVGSTIEGLGPSVLTVATTGGVGSSAPPASVPLELPSLDEMSIVAMRGDFLVGFSGGISLLRFFALDFRLGGSKLNPFPPKAVGSSIHQSGMYGKNS